MKKYSTHCRYTGYALLLISAFLPPEACIAVGAFAWVFTEAARSYAMAGLERGE
jgi:hypothetical protein